MIFEPLRAYLNRNGDLTEDQLVLIESVFTLRNYDRGVILQRAGEVASRVFFVTRGCLRKYVIDEKGKEHVVQFMPENHWVGDSESAASKTPMPTRYFIDAIEPTEVLVTDGLAMLELFRSIPVLFDQYSSGLQRAQAAKERRIVSALQASARERYLEFLEKYPTLVLRIPGHMLASYLGITPETLSRIRASIK